MSDDYIESPESDYEIKLTKKKNVVPFKHDSQIEKANNDVDSVEISTDIDLLKKDPSALRSIIAELQSQIALLDHRLHTEDVTPEFKALMEGYIKKANESEELKVKLEDANTKLETAKCDLTQLRDANRDLTNELNSTRETLRDFEDKIQNNERMSESAKSEQRSKLLDYRKKIDEAEDKVVRLEDEKSEIKEQMEKRVVELIKSQENLKQEISDMDFDFRQRERDLINEVDKQGKQIKEYEKIVKEMEEKLELKTKEAEYKATLLDQIAKQSTLNIDGADGGGFLNSVVERRKKQKKQKFWPLG